MAVNNPVVGFLLETLAGAHSRSEYQAVLADLASSRKGEDRLELHVQLLYNTQCANCGQTIPAKSFLWRKNELAPYASLYHCPHCGDESEHPLEEAELERLAQITRGDGLPRARALERVVPLEDPTRADVQEALDCYLPRPLYALFTLINKLDGLALPPTRKRLLTALLLSACDEANTLWQHPTARARPRQLTVPTNFRENNLWLALEAAVDTWAESNRVPVPLTTWPDQPPAGGGICLFRGRYKDFYTAAPAFKPAAVLTALPRPNQAFWTLSALWAGWLWGREAVAPLKSVLSRRRYDWNWHTAALHATFDDLAAQVSPETPLFALLAEVEPAFVSAALIAAHTAGFHLDGLALREEGSLAHIRWSPASGAGRIPALFTVERAKIAAGEYLEGLAEPATYLQLYAATTAALAHQETLAPAPQQASSDFFGHFQNGIRQAFSDRTLFVRYGGGEHTLESGLWGLKAADPHAQPLADRVEMELVRSLQKHPGGTLAELDGALCAAFPGLLTPPLSLVQGCLSSYGEQQPAASGCWQLRAEDSPLARRADLKQMRDLLEKLGQHLGYRVEGERPVLWEQDGETAYAFYVLASAIIARYVFAGQYPPGQSVIVLPGGRANLLAYKLRHDPRLDQAVRAGWRFIKFRHLRRLAENPFLNPETWAKQIDSDPPELQAMQMDMF